jgi:hypothetical protein
MVSRFRRWAKLKFRNGPIQSTEITQAIHMILHIIKGNGGGLAAKLDILVADHPTHILFRANYKNCFGNLGSIKE